MAAGSGPSRNWFDQGGMAYSRFRPEYPAQLASFLATVSPDTTLAVDVGCGSGQLTIALARHFDAVMGFDPSADQIAHATVHRHVHYRCAAAEQLPVADHAARLVTAAQAAHWFDLPRFYSEARRILVPHGVLALISYGVLRTDPDLSDCLDQFYRVDLGPYWPPERRLVDSGYADLSFPFAEQVAPTLEICKEWTLAALLGYLSTWSAVRKAQEAGRKNLLQQFAADLTGLWGDPSRCRTVRWPINMRLGRS